VQQLKGDGQVQVLVRVRREITNWDTLYFRLRSLFDGYSSAWYPTPPSLVGTDGPAVYERHREVISMDHVLDTEADEQSSQLALKVRARDTGETYTTRADLVIAADGPNSSIRAKYLPGVSRNYAGYIAWRGTVPETEVSDASREIFRRSVTVHRMDCHHCLVYSIPGKHGSLETGEKVLNFLWYTNESEESVDEIMKDSLTGHRHHYIVPAGRVRQDLWDAQLSKAKSAPLPGPFLEVINKIRQPFIQLITDFRSPRAAFEGGRVLLVGDALSLYRPHTAFSATQAAFDALMVEAYTSGQMSLDDWEEKVLRYASLHSSQAIMWGEFYQRRIAVAMAAALYHRMFSGLDRFKSWWSGEMPLLRSTIPAEEDSDQDGEE
jgi:hypothetical protein